MTAASDTGDSNSDNITNKTKPSFTLMCTEAGSTLTLYVDGVANGTVNCTGPGPVNVAPTTPLSEGNHAITFTETDAAGNASQGSPALTVTIDTTAPAAPAVTVDSVTADNTINAAEAAAPQIIRGLATGTRPGDKVRVTVNGTTYETTVDGTGAFAVTVPGAELVSDPDHTIDVTVIASDVAGNTTSTSMTKTYNVDADVVAPPAKATLKSSSDSGASDSDNITNNTTPTVILQCISATDKLHLIVDGVEVQTINCTAVGPVEVTLPNALNDGNHTVVYRRETPAGNISAPSTPLTLTIDTIAPTGTLGTQQATAESVHLDRFPAVDESLIDSELEARMELAQQTTSLVLSLRKKERIIVRQPLQRIAIPVTDPLVRTRLEAVQQLVLDEVNVKTIDFVEGQMLEKKVKCNFRVMGKKFGKLMKAVNEVVTAISQDQIAELEKNGTLTVEVEGESCLIERNDVEIISEDMPGWSVANEGALTVALDITITDELRNEGVAREIVKRVQAFRKESGFEITDRIRIVVEQLPVAEKAIADFCEFIAGQVLAESITLAANVESETEFDLDGTNVKFLINKV